MKARILSAAAAWLVVITLLHVHLNVGWAGLRENIRILFGGEREELIVGFLPVT